MGFFGVVQQTAAKGGAWLPRSTHPATHPWIGRTAPPDFVHLCTRAAPLPDSIEQEFRVLAERIEILIHENARVAQDQTEYLKQENEIRALYVEKQGHLARLDEQIAEREGKRKSLETIIQVICGINGEQTEFDEDLWSGLLNHICVQEDGQIVVVFKGGIEIGVRE